MKQIHYRNNKKNTSEFLKCTKYFADKCNKNFNFDKITKINNQNIKYTLAE